MNRLLILACCICAISANPLQKVDISRPRIVFGNTIGIEDVPYQVSIVKLLDEERESHYCGGSILSKNLILTAGHCIDSEADKYMVRSGSSTWRKGGKLHKVVEVIMHDDYKEDRFGRPNHDLAIMKVSPEFELDGQTERISKLANKYDKVRAGDDAYVPGWGKTEYNSLSEQLKGLALKIVDYTECTKNYKRYGDMTKYNICAAHPSGTKDMCNGDSGGPLVVKGKQVGIVSWSEPGCATPGRPGVYVDVAKYRDWIDKQVASL